MRQTIDIYYYVTLCVPGVRARAWRGDYRGAEAAGGAGAGGEGEEAEGDRGDAQQKGDRLTYTLVRMSSCHHIHFVFQPDEDDSFRHHMLKIKSTMEIAPEKAYCV